MFVFPNTTFKFLIFYPHFPTFCQQNSPVKPKGSQKQTKRTVPLVCDVSRPWKSGGDGVWDRGKFEPRRETFLIEARWR